MQTQNIQSSAAGGKRGVSDSSAIVFDAMGNNGKQKQQNDVFAICVREQNKGHSDLTTKEIARLLEEQRSMEAGHYVRVDASNITAPIDRLRAAGRIVRTAEKRPCGHSKNNVWAYFVPMSQLRLVA